MEITKYNGRYYVIRGLDIIYATLYFDDAKDMARILRDEPTDNAYSDYPDEYDENKKRGLLDN